MLSRSKHVTRSNFPLCWSTNPRRNSEIYFAKLDGRPFVRPPATRSSRRRKIGRKAEGKPFPARYAPLCRETRDAHVRSFRQLKGAKKKALGFVKRRMGEGNLVVNRRCSSRRIPRARDTEKRRNPPAILSFLRFLHRRGPRGLLNQYEQYFRRKLGHIRFFFEHSIAP